MKCAVRILLVTVNIVVQAANVTWNNDLCCPATRNSDWNDGTCWDRGLAPGIGDRAVFVLPQEKCSVFIMDGSFLKMRQISVARDTTVSISENALLTIAGRSLNTSISTDSLNLATSTKLQFQNTEIFLLGSSTIDGSLELANFPLEGGCLIVNSGSMQVHTEASTQQLIGIITN